MVENYTDVVSESTCWEFTGQRKHGRGSANLSPEHVIIQGGRLIWFPPYMVWLFSTCKGYDSSIIILKNGHNLGSDYHFLMKLSGLFSDG